MFIVRIHHPAVKPFPNKLSFLRVCSTSLLKTLWEKEKLLVTSNFSFSRSVFYPFGELSAIFIKFEIVVCKIFPYGRVCNLSFWNLLSIGQCRTRDLETQFQASLYLPDFFMGVSRWTKHFRALT